jgi:hypothetical protein
MLWLLYPKGNSPWYPLDRRLGGPQSQSGRGGEEKNSQPLPVLGTPTIQPVAERYIAELPGSQAVFIKTSKSLLYYTESHPMFCLF